jgi:hypothetical protein
MVSGSASDSPMSRSRGRVTSVLYRYSGVLCGAFLAFSAFAFWPSYFSQPPRQFDVRFHLHALSLMLWCLLLVAQGVLIRTNHRLLHRMLGQAGYGLVPFIVLATLSLLHHRLPRGVNELPEQSLYTLSLVLNQLIVFVVLWGLAMRHRREPAVHARFMVCTVMPLFSAPMNRVAIHSSPALFHVAALLAGSTPVLFEIVYSLPVYILLIVLSVWDWRARTRVNVFPVALGLMVLLQVSVLSSYRTAWWRSFGERVLGPTFP